MEHNNEKITIEVDRPLANRIRKQAEYRRKVQDNIRDFWNKKGEDIIIRYKDQLIAPNHKNITEEVFRQNLKECQVLIISANSVEGIIVSKRLLLSSNTTELEAMSYEGHLFQFARIGGIPVCHIWPTDTSSFTQYGSFSALEAALEITTPKYVMSVGVAFGIDPDHQSLGDVLISKDIVFYDHFNKVTNGVIGLNPHETYRIDANLTASLHQLESKIPPKEVGDFKWYFNALLSGGTVLSDAEEKDKLVNAASGVGYRIAGGEMEASGIYYACQKRKNRRIPFMIIKGICDWGAEKNGWEEAIETKYDGDTIKDCVQAFACDNAFNTLSFILERLNYNRGLEDAENNQKTRQEKSKDGSKDTHSLMPTNDYFKVYEVREKSGAIDAESGCSFLVNSIYIGAGYISITINQDDGSSITKNKFYLSQQYVVGKDNDYTLVLSEIEDCFHCRIVVMKRK